MVVNVQVNPESAETNHLFAISISVSANIRYSLAETVITPISYINIVS
jgi:hypothetical protein